MLVTGNNSLTSHKWHHGKHGLEVDKHLTHLLTKEQRLTVHSVDTLAITAPQLSGGAFGMKK